MTRKHPNLLLREARLNNHWDQIQVATLLGVTSLTVGRWERGEYSPSSYFQMKLTQLFGLSLTQLGFSSLTEGNLSKDETQQTALLDPMIPLSSQPLIGRDGLVESLRQHLSTGSPEIALYGLPGVGKTSLALSLTTDPTISALFPDGTLWAGLGPTPNVPEILSRWGALLGIAGNGVGASKRSETWGAILRETIGARRFLIVLDDIWDYRDASLLKVGGLHCTYVATTRSPHTAIAFAMQGAVGIPELSEENSVLLLEYLAPEITTYDDKEQILAIVRSVGALPLALMLAGKYLHRQGYSGQKRRLHSAIQNLLDANHRLQLSEPIGIAGEYPSLSLGTALSLQSLIAVSDYYLDEQAQQALRAFSVFPSKPNTFSEEAALTVSNAPIEVLDTLCDVGLLEINVKGRYTLHQTIMDYARTKQIDQEPSQKFIGYYQTFIQHNQANLEILELESQNIFAALERASSVKNQEAFVQMVLSLTHFFLHRGLYDLGKMYLHRAYDGIAAEEDTQKRAQLLYFLGMIAQKQGEYLHAITFYEEGLISARQRKNSDLICTFLSALGWATEKRGNYVQAETYIQEGLSLAHELKNQASYCTLLRVLGTLSDNKGEYQQAKDCYQKALALAQDLHDDEQCCILFIDLGIVIQYEGKIQEATYLYKEGLAIAQQIGHLEWQCLALLNLGSLLCESLREYQQANVICLEALKIVRQIGHREWLAQILHMHVGITTRLQGPNQAKPIVQEALEVARQIEKPILIGYLLAEEGKIALQNGDLDHAAVCFTQQCEITPENMLARAEIARNMALLAAARGEQQEALTQMKVCIALSEQTGYLSLHNDAKKWLEHGCPPIYSSSDWAM